MSRAERTRDFAELGRGFATRRFEKSLDLHLKTMSVDATLERIADIEADARFLKDSLWAMVRRPMSFYVQFGDEKGAIRKLIRDIADYSDLYVQCMRAQVDGLPGEELENFREIVRGWKTPILKLRDLVLLWRLPERTFRGMIAEGTSHHLPTLLAIEAARTLAPHPRPPPFDPSSAPPSPPS